MFGGASRDIVSDDSDPDLDTEQSAAMASTDDEHQNGNNVFEEDDDDDLRDHPEPAQSQNQRSAPTPPAADDVGERSNFAFQFVGPDVEADAKCPVYRVSATHTQHLVKHHEPGKKPVPVGATNDGKSVQPENLVYARINRASGDGTPAYAPLAVTDRKFGVFSLARPLTVAASEKMKRRAFKTTNPCLKSIVHDIDWAWSASGPDDPRVPWDVAHVLGSDEDKKKQKGVPKERGGKGKQTADTAKETKEPKEPKETKDAKETKETKETKKSGGPLDLLLPPSAAQGDGVDQEQKQGDEEESEKCDQRGDDSEPRDRAAAAPPPKKARSEAAGARDTHVQAPEKPPPAGAKKRVFTLTCGSASFTGDAEQVAKMAKLFESGELDT